MSISRLFQIAWLLFVVLFVLKPAGIGLWRFVLLVTRKPKAVGRNELRRLFEDTNGVLWVAAVVMFVQVVGTVTVTENPKELNLGGMFQKPHRAFLSKVGYYLIKPQRGSIVFAVGEHDAAIAPNWENNIPSKYHFLEENKGAYQTDEEFGGRILKWIWARPAGRIRRVIGMPGETVCMRGGRVSVLGKDLNEPYVSGYADKGDPVCFSLPENAFLLARDVRSEQAVEAADSAFVVNLSQIRGRYVFTFWPREDFGFVRTPRYNITDPPLLKIDPNKPILRTFVNM